MLFNYKVLHPTSLEASSGSLPACSRGGDRADRRWAAAALTMAEYRAWQRRPGAGYGRGGL